MIRGLRLAATPIPIDGPQTGSRLPHVVPELVIAGVLLLIGLRSLLKWIRIRYDAESTGDQFLFTLHVTARVGMWFALAGFFVGYAIVDEPQSLGWYVFVVLGLAGLRLMTSFYLWRSSDRPDD